MAQGESSSLGSISLAELVALNDEIAALARAGVPLEPALAELGADMPGRLGQIATLVAQRTGRGESLLQVISSQSIQLPPVYRAVVEAGLRSGRLSSALEALAGALRRVADTRRAVAVAAIYPLLVVMLAWGMAAFFVSKIAPKPLMGFAGLHSPAKGVIELLARCGHWAVYWGPVVPLLILIAAGIWWYYSSRAAMVESVWAGRLLGWLPWMGKTLRWSRTATFAEVLTLLVESRVPLDEAIVLAAETSGERRTIAAARQLAEALQRGEPLHRAGLGTSPFPPVLLWLLAAGQRQGDLLLPALRSAAETYRQQARYQADLARVFLPALATIAIGGTATLLFALMLFVPYTSILRALAGP